jgi:hypothetical protein
MEFALAKWITVEEMIEHIHSKEFEQTGFGDIYSKRISQKIIS